MRSQMRGNVRAMCRGGLLSTRKQARSQPTALRGGSKIFDFPSRHASLPNTRRLIGIETMTFKVKVFGF
jgi:hypothetical protein